MTNDLLCARRGDLVVFSSGEYSDFGYNGHFVALEDIAAEHFAAAKAEADERYRIVDEAQDAWTSKEANGEYPNSVDRHEVFLAHLIRAGLLLSIAVTVHHLGSYGEIDL